jgi:MoCo/4Fe-4S cofactor protein with predicted Tat translocation signal
MSIAAGSNGSDNKAGKTVDHETKNASAPMTLAQVRQELKGVKGKRFWRSVDELADTAEFQAAVEREFPAAAQEWVDPVSRRGFLKVMGASMALAGLAGCTKQPEETIYPYIKQPEDLVLGKPMYFATAHPFPTGGVPLLVKSDEFRPIKIDGNPEHAYNRGGSDPYSQGSLLDLYDPDMFCFAVNGASGPSLLRRFASKPLTQKMAPESIS